MRILRYFYIQSEDELVKGIIFAIVLAIIMTIVSAILTDRIFNVKMIENQFRESECVFVDNELSCNEDYIEFGYGVYIINLNPQEDFKYSSNQIIFLKDSLVTGGNELSYINIAKDIGNYDEDIAINEVTDLISQAVKNMSLVFMFIAFVAQFLLGNFILAFVMKFLIYEILKKDIDYKQTYILTLYTIIPYVLFDALIMLIFSKSISTLITSSSFLTIVIDYIIIGIITLLTVKEGIKWEKERHEKFKLEKKFN